MKDSTHFFREERFGFSFIFYLNFWFSRVIDDFERPMFHVGLNNGIVEFSTD